MFFYDDDTQRKTMSLLNEKHVIINRHFLYFIIFLCLWLLQKYVFILPCQYSYLNNVNLWELMPPNFNAATENLNPKYADLTKLQLQPQQTRPIRKDLATWMKNKLISATATKFSTYKFELNIIINFTLL